jgi:hypothetical protein
MTEFIEHPITPTVEVRVTREMPPLSAELEAQIDRLWDRAAARVEAGGAAPLFNGRIFTIDHLTPSRIDGHMTEYRRQVAQMEDNALYEQLGIRPLAVVGVTRCADGIVVGRRHAGAVYQPNMWQLCPAGSVDADALRADGTIDLQFQILGELAEELGVTAEVTDLKPLCLVEHPGSHVSDLGMAITLKLRDWEIISAHRVSGNREYQTVSVISEDRLDWFIDFAGATLVPPATLLLRQAGLFELSRDC